MTTRAPLTPEQRFEQSLRDGQPKIQKCEACGALRFPPREVCHACLSAKAAWLPVPEDGAVISWIVVHTTAVPNHPTPYTVVHVELDEGVRMTGKLLEGTPSIGLRVRARLQEAEGRVLMQFVAT